MWECEPGIAHTAIEVRRFSPVLAVVRQRIAKYRKILLQPNQGPMRDRSAFPFAPLVPTGLSPQWDNRCKKFAAMRQSVQKIYASLLFTLLNSPELLSEAHFGKLSFSKISFGKLSLHHLYCILVTDWQGMDEICIDKELSFPQMQLAFYFWICFFCIQIDDGLHAMFYTASDSLLWVWPSKRSTCNLSMPITSCCKK